MMNGKQKYVNEGVSWPSKLITPTKKFIDRSGVIQYQNPVAMGQVPRSTKDKALKLHRDIFKAAEN